MSRTPSILTMDWCWYWFICEPRKPVTEPFVKIGLEEVLLTALFAIWSGCREHGGARGSGRRKSRRREEGTVRGRQTERANEGGQKAGHHAGKRLSAGTAIKSHDIKDPSVSTNSYYIVKQETARPRSAAERPPSVLPTASTGRWRKVPSKGLPPLPPDDFFDQPRPTPPDHNFEMLSGAHPMLT